MAYVEDIDKGMREISADLEELSRYEIKVGVQAGEQADDSGTTIAEIAAYNEYGTDRIPERPFFRNAIAKHNNWDDDRDKVVNTVIDGARPSTMIELLGQKAEADMRDSIRFGSFVPNAPSTIKRKKSDKPLIDKGTLIGSIRYRIDKS